MADRVGVYDISGALMPSPGTVVSRQTRSVLFVVSASSTGTIIGSVIGELSSSQHEVSRLNTFYSGSERFESGSNIPFWYDSGSTPVQYGSWAERDLYYSKQQRLRYSNEKHIPTIVDLSRNVPRSSPLGSSGAMTTLKVAGLAGTGVAVSMSLIGTVGGTSTPYQLIIDDWSAGTHLGTGSISPAPPLLISAMTCNAVYINGVAALVTSSQYGSSLTLFYGYDGATRLEEDGFNPSPSANVYLLSWVPLSSSVSGVFFNRTAYDPTTVSVPVTESGKIRDLRVWVEFVHDCRTTGSVESGLQSTAIALRSPNMSFRSAYPLWNDPSVTGLPILSGGINEQTYLGGVPELLRSSYLLWSGHKTEAAISSSFPSSSSGSIPVHYYEFDRDIDMRTVFWDGSPVNNPRDVKALFPSASARDAGSPLPSSSLTSTLQDAYQSPTLGLLRFYNFSLPNPSDAYSALNGTSGSLSCSRTPWFLDTRLSGAGILSDTASYPTLVGSGTIPKGWLTGGPSEFATTGSQLGPSTIRPVFQILDDVYALKIIDDADVLNPFKFGGSRKRIEGMRPGLRGSEMSGTWDFIVGGAFGQYDAGLPGYPPLSSSGIWLRQVRLEMISDASSSVGSFIPSAERRYTRSTNVKSDGYSLVSISSGSCNWDAGLNLVRTFQDAEYGRSVSITDATSSSPDSYAVLTFITGALGARLQASGSGSPSWFLNYPGTDVSRPTGTPYIPDSSMSLGTGSAEQIDASASAEILKIAGGINSSIPGSNVMQSYLSRQNYTQTAAAAAEARVATMYSGSAS